MAKSKSSSGQTPATLHLPIAGQLYTLRSLPLTIMIAVPVVCDVGSLGDCALISSGLEKSPITWIPFWRGCVCVTCS